jgi:uroporphyrinogen-III synthase
MTAAGPSQGGHSAPSEGSEAWGQSAAAGALAGIGVLVTRPREQASRLLSRLQGLGATPILFSVLVIEPTAHPQALSAILGRIDQYDLHLFVSPTAAQFGFAALPDGAAGSLRAAGIGAGTAAALRAAGVEYVIAPSHGADSEHLLALPQFADLTGKRVLIFRGEGGRELIADTLRARGAEVDYAECYRRACPQIDPAPLRQALVQQQIQAITAFSSETLDNLLALLASDGLNATQACARALPLFVPHARIAQHARSLNFTQVIATGPGEDGVLSGLVEYFRA